MIEFREPVGLWLSEVLLSREALFFCVNFGLVSGPMVQVPSSIFNSQVSQMLSNNTLLLLSMSCLASAFVS